MIDCVCAVFPGVPSTAPGIAGELSITFRPIICCILLNPRVTLPAMFHQELYQQKEQQLLFAASTNMQHLKDLCLWRGWLGNNPWQPCIFLPLMSSLKLDIDKTLVQQFHLITDAAKRTQRLLILINLSILPACGAFGRCLDLVSTHRQEQMHQNFNFQDKRRRKYVRSLFWHYTLHSRTKRRTQEPQQLPGLSSTRDHAASY